MSKPEPSVETPEQIADGIVNQIAIGAWTFCSPGWVKGMIVSALKARDERAVRIIEEHRQMDVCNDNCWTTIKATIREGKVTE